MPTGKIKNWIEDKGYGFIADDDGGPDVFLHISEVSPGDKAFLKTGTEVNFEMRQTDRGFAAHEVRLHAPSSGKSQEHFHNPYTFIPTPPRQKAIQEGEFAGDFNPLKCGLDHASLKDGLWTGHIPIKLTTVTPLVLPKTEGEKRDSSQHQTYDVLDYIPESSLRGMLRSAYEVVTNSRYACFRNDDRLAYRMIPRESLKLIPAIIENGNNPGELEACLYPGTSAIGPQRPNGPMYAAMLNKNAKYVNGGEPKTRDEVWAEIDCRRHKRGYQYWKVLQISPTSNNLVKQSATGKIVKGHVLITNENMGNKHDERIFFIHGKNAKNPIKCAVTHLKDSWRMRIQSYRDAHSETDIFKRKGAQDKPWKKIDKGADQQDEMGWSPHLYEDGKHNDRWNRPTHDALELRVGDMVYARCEFNDKGEITGIKDLFPVMISRELYKASPEELLDDSLKPAKRMCKLSPADRLFGWVLQKETQDQEKTSEDADKSSSNDTEKQDQDRKIPKGYKSRIRVVCDDGPRPKIVQRFGGGSLPLTILGQPKPAQGRFYVAKDGKPQDKKGKQAAGYEVDMKKTKSLRGRKQYWHHQGLEAELKEDKQNQCYWEPSVEDRTFKKRKDRYQEYRRPDILNKQDNRHKLQTDSQNRSITGWIEPGTEFKASLYVQNLQPEEVGALLWLLTLPDKHYFRMGYGKPLGFGSVKMKIDKERLINGCLPLGKSDDWKAYYKTLFGDLSYATLDKCKQEKYIEKFKESIENAYKRSDEGQEPKKETFENFEQLAASEGVTTPEKQGFDGLPFISGFLRVLQGPGDNAPIHYPRLEDEEGGYKPNPEGKNFEWFTKNEDNKKHALPLVTQEDKGLPYDPT